MIFCCMMDRVSGQFGQPFFAPHVAAVSRDLSLMVNNPDIPYEYIRDTVVMQFGTFDSDPVNPRFDLFDIPKIIWKGDSVDVREIREKLNCNSDFEAD